MPVVRALFISLVGHLFFSWLLVQLPMAWLTSKPSLASPSVEVQILDSSENSRDKRQVVRETEIPESQKAPDDQSAARFLSAQRQRVWLETQAQKTGLTQNRSRKHFENQKKENPSSEEKDGYKPVDFSKALKDSNEGFSTVGETLPKELSVGSFTALNTDQYQFYSFYARVEELVRFRWETRVRNAVDLFDRRHLLRQIGDRDWITQAVFLLDENGRLQKVQLMKESGLPAFDSAAVQTFQEVLIFPNPPKEMIEGDGYVHLKYSFNVHFNASLFARD